MTMTAETPANPILDAALDLLANGYSIVPIRADASKAPALASWRHYTAQRATPDTVRGWFADGGHDLGVVQGAISGGAELTELEGRAAHRLPELRELAYASGLGDVWDAITRGWVEMSPSGGWHFHYRVTGIDVPGNLKLARNADREVLAETRGEGGQVVVAPSTRHATGQPWRRIVGSPATAPTITAEERGALHDLLRTLDEQPERPAPAPRPASTADRQGSGDRLKPGDDYEARTDWADILEPHGWTLVYTQGRTRYWRRPGKTIGISATTGHAEDRDRLYVFTSSTEFQTETPYTKFGAYAVLDHHGDHAAAARELGRTGYGDKPQLAEVIHLTHANLADAVAAETPGAAEEADELDRTADALEHTHPMLAASMRETAAEERADPAQAAPAVRADPLEQRIQERVAQLIIDGEAKKRHAALTGGTRDDTPIWVDNAEILAGGFEPTEPTIGLTLPSGGHLFYAAAVNGIVGDPAAAKTLLVTANCVDQLHADPAARIAWFDLDHNGAPALLTRYRRWGLSHDDVVNRIRLTLPEDSVQLLDAVDELIEDPAAIVVIDSVGELLPMFGASSNDADEYTGVHQQVMKRLATAGSAVITIDHLSKGNDSRQFGATGTIAKKRAYDGALIRATVDQPFTPGTGGTSELRILKDRHGGLLKHAVGGGREPLLGMWTLTERENDATAWSMGEWGSSVATEIADVDAVAELDPPATGYRDVKARLGWRDQRAQDAWRTFRELQKHSRTAR